ncbi:ATP-binding protein [Tissierella sp. MB52-C2]|uniref:metallophosphoesterase n=1 Tax=Tissierella sp. MB52-C2 TaxID=3070999 RepID=UPI00280BBA1B|nr:metallophosphoesterase [Tissierella sp. MB52-C2]WMM26024.1 ATP-binding protein [Tissierella sp. MB52-C2]
MEFRVLHLSDVHIGKTYKPSESIAYRIVSDIEHNKMADIDCVITTGDIFEGTIETSETLIREAVNFYEIILKEINYNQTKQLGKTDFIFVPGNHDIIRTDNIDERWEKYHSFIQMFYETIPESYNTDFSVYKPYHDNKIVFIGFNSCQIENKKIFDKEFISKLKSNLSSEVLGDYNIDRDKLIEILEEQKTSEFDDYGNISLQQIADIKRKLKQVTDYNIIALFHHHFYLFPEVSKKFGDSSLIRNYSEFIQELKYMGVKTVLHGHKHFDLERPYISDDYYDTTESIINIFAGGSVGTSRTDRHTFSIINFYDKKEDVKLIQKKFIYNGESLEPIQTKRIPPKNTLIKVVKLLELLKVNNPDKFNEYQSVAEKNYSIYNDCNKIIEWLSEIFTGFNETYKILYENEKNILFILYAVNYRTLKYKEIIEKNDTEFESKSTLLQAFYNKILNGPDFQVCSKDFHELFNSKNLSECAKYCDELLNSINKKTSQYYLALTMIAIFFSDLYLILTKYADDFKHSIKYKVNIKIEDNKFHENVPAPRIIINSDSDRRSAYIQLLCNDATAHKMAVLFIKEFDLMINKYEDYFKLIGLKLYYLLPQINSDNVEKALDNYNFEAYIPTLLPLLTGDNIYPAKEVFARELIQNSIDAIAVREAKDTIQFANKIYIEISKDVQGRRFFKIKDNGTGMDRYKIERYFTSIGRSFYSDEEYQDLNIRYKPISNFGIGFLSSFMVCREIDVKTRYYTEESEALKLHIPNYEGCFFIEKEKGVDIGTEIILYLNHNIENKKIVDYIQDTMLDVKYEIILNYTSDKAIQETIIPAHNLRKKALKSDFKLFVPLSEDYSALKLDYEKDIISGNFISEYKYGILIHNNISEKRSVFNVLNAGILVQQASLSKLFGRGFDNEYQSNIRDKFYYKSNILANFPANWIQLDVSREKLVGFSEDLKKIIGKDIHLSVGVQIAEVLLDQIRWILNNSESSVSQNPVINLQEAILFAIDFCNRSNNTEIYKKLLVLKYILHIDFTKEEIVFALGHKGDCKERINVTYSAEMSRKNINELLERIGTLDFREDLYIDSIHKNDIREIHPMLVREFYRFLEEFVITRDIKMSKNFRYKFEQIIHTTSFSESDQADDILKIIAIIMLLYLDKQGELQENLIEKSPIVSIIERILMERINIRDVEEKSASIIIKYEELNELFELRKHIDKLK